MLQIKDIMMKSEALKNSAKNNSEKDFEFSYYSQVDDALIEGILSAAILATGVTACSGKTDHDTGETNSAVTEETESGSDFKCFQYPRRGKASGF